MISGTREAFFYYSGAMVACSGIAGIGAYSDTPPSWWVFAIMAGAAATLASLELAQMWWGKTLRSRVGP